MNDFVEKMASISDEILKIKESEKVIVAGFQVVDFLSSTVGIVDTIGFFADVCTYFTKIGNIQVYPCIYMKSTEYSIMTRKEYAEFLEKMELEQEIKNRFK